MKHFLLLFAFIATVTAQAQGIKLTDLTKLLAKNSVDEVKSNLEPKGWVFYRKEPAVIAGLTTWIWTYKYRPKTDEAVGWMSVSFDGEKPVRVLYEIFDYDITSPFTLSVYGSEFKYEDIDEEDEEFVTRYSTDKYYLWEYMRKGYEKGYQYECLTKFSKADERNGTKKTYYDSGKVKTEYEVRENKLNGKSTMYWENGNLKKVSNWKNDKEQGLFQFYNEDGVIESDEMYKDGKLEGPANFYYPSGKLQSTCEYSYGKKSGTAQAFSESGQLTNEYKYIGGVKFGDYKEYRNGIESFKGYYMNDKLNSMFTETLFDEDGKPYAIMKGYYKDDYLDGAIVALYIDTKDTLSYRKYKSQKPYGEWRYYDKEKQLTKKMRFTLEQKADYVEYYSSDGVVERVSLTKEDKDFWYFDYSYAKETAKINAAFRVLKSELEVNEHEFMKFEEETQLFELGSVVDASYKFGPYSYDNDVMTFSGQYDENNEKTGQWKRFYKSSKVLCTIALEAGVVNDEYFTDKKGKPFSGKLSYTMSDIKYTIPVKNGRRNGTTVEKNLKDKTEERFEYVNGEYVQ